MIVVLVYVGVSFRDGVVTGEAAHHARAFAGVGRAVVDSLTVGVGDGIADATGAIGTAEPMVPSVRAHGVGVPFCGIQIAATVIAGIAVGGKILQGRRHEFLVSAGNRRVTVRAGAVVVVAVIARPRSSRVTARRRASRLSANGANTAAVVGVGVRSLSAYGTVAK